MRDALAAATICSYAQGMALLRVASAEYRWGVDLRETVRIWKGGCIIRARLLDTIIVAFEHAPVLTNLMVDATLSARLSEVEVGLRRTLEMANAHGIPMPVMSASLPYFDSYRTAVLPQNLTQAQRDYVGAHTYQRRAVGCRICAHRLAGFDRGVRYSGQVMTTSLPLPASTRALLTRGRCNHFDRFTHKIGI